VRGLLVRRRRAGSGGLVIRLRLMPSGLWELYSSTDALGQTIAMFPPDAPSGSVAVALRAFRLEQRRAAKQREADRLTDVAS